MAANEQAYCTSLDLGSGALHEYPVSVGLASNHFDSPSTALASRQPPAFAIAFTLTLNSQSCNQTASTLLLIPNKPKVGVSGVRYGKPAQTARPDGASERKHPIGFEIHPKHFPKYLLLHLPCNESAFEAAFLPTVGFRHVQGIRSTRRQMQADASFVRPPSGTDWELSPPRRNVPGSMALAVSCGSALYLSVFIFSPYFVHDLPLLDKAARCSVIGFCKMSLTVCGLFTSSRTHTNHSY